MPGRVTGTLITVERAGGRAPPPRRAPTDALAIASSRLGWDFARVWSIRVLVVDDTPSARFLVRGLVEDSGHEVVGQARNGAEGVRAALDLDPDVVVMDWSMPVMDGLEATVAIKKQSPRTQIIAFTSTADRELHERFLASGACDHVAKGDIEGLLGALERCGSRVT